MIVLSVKIEQVRHSCTKSQAAIRKITLPLNPEKDS
jgi:hypothetical protein